MSPGKAAALGIPLITFDIRELHDHRDDHSATFLCPFLVLILKIIILVILISSKRVEVHFGLNTIFIKSISDNAVKSDHVFSLQRTTMNTELLLLLHSAPGFSSHWRPEWASVVPPVQSKTISEEISAQNFRGHIQTFVWKNGWWQHVKLSLLFLLGQLFMAQNTPFHMCCSFGKKDFISNCFLTQSNDGMVTDLWCIKSQLWAGQKKHNIFYMKCRAHSSIGFQKLPLLL